MDCVFRPCCSRIFRLLRDTFRVFSLLCFRFPSDDRVPCVALNKRAARLHSSHLVTPSMLRSLTGPPQCHYATPSPLPAYFPCPMETTRPAVGRFVGNSLAPSLSCMTEETPPSPPFDVVSEVMRRPFGTHTRWEELLVAALMR